MSDEKSSPAIKILSSIVVPIITALIGASTTYFVTTYEKAPPPETEVKIESFPIVAMGGDFWNSLSRFIQDGLISEGTISASDLNLIHLTDSIDEAMRIIRRGFDEG